MNLLTRIMSYDKTKNESQENCNCEECTNVEEKLTQYFQNHKIIKINLF